MKRQDLKELVRESNLKPIRICVADGASYKVTHPDFALLTRETLIRAAGPGHDFGDRDFVVIPLEHISRVELRKRRARTT